MEQSVTRVSGMGKVARVLLVALLSLAGLSLIGVGKAYAASPPTVTGLGLTTGGSYGGDTVVVKGTGFSASSTVTFGGVPAASVVFTNPFRITATSPVPQNGTAVVDVQVTTGGLTSAITPADQFTYFWISSPTVTAVTPNVGPIAGGTSVTITGTYLAGPSAVSFGATPASSVHVVTDQSITAVAPAGTANTTVDITVTTPFSGGSTSPISRADTYSYVTKPTVTAVTTAASPAGGPTGGGTQVQIAGTGFASVSAVHFGANPATIISNNSFGTLTATAPPGTGTVDVTVTTPLGTSDPSPPNDQYTYNGTLTLVPGTASYNSGVSTSTGATPNPTVVDSFNASTLVTGGTTIDPAQTVVVTQPASGGGTVAISGNQVLYTPAETTTSTGSGANTVWTYTTTTTGTQTATIAICTTGSTYPSAGCATTTITYLQASTGFYMGDQLSAPGGLLVSVVIDTGAGVSAPTTANSGSTITTETAPTMALIPASQSGFVVLGAGAYQAITPVPVGLTLVPGSLHVTGGDPSSTGKYIVTLCTAAMGYIAGECTAQNTGNYKTTPPYIETALDPATLIPGGTQLTLPSVTAQWTVTASAGATVNSYETEFAVSTLVKNIGATNLDAYPSDLASYNNQGIGAPAPTYTAPSPRYSINVTSGGTFPPTFTSGNSATFTAGTAGSFDVTASGNPAPTFSVPPGSLPTGVTLSSAGVLSGTPAAGTGGLHTFTITASNGISPDATQSFTLTVNEAPTITSAAATTFTVGSPGTFTVAATGYPLPTFGTTGTLPTGVTLNAATGVLSGTPAAGQGGSYSFTITASNTISPAATQVFTLTVDEAPTITSANATSFEVNTPDTFTVTASGFPASTFSITTGTLPTGVTLNGATGVLSGTPALGTNGTYPITLKAANGTAPDATQAFTLTVGNFVPPTITSASSATFTINTAGTFTVTATGSPVPTFSEMGALPAGVTLNASTGVLSGTPTSGGSYPITITATNGIAPNATQNFTLTVATAPSAPTITNVSAGDGQVTVTWIAGSNGGSPIQSFRADAALGAGFCTAAFPATSCTVTGLTNGTPYTFTVTATNAVGTSPASIASMPVTPTANGPIPGYWTVTSGGAVLTNGAAVSYGSPAGLSLSAPIVGMAPTPDRKGYWVAGADGGVFAYGDAGFFGSAGAENLNQPIVGIAATSDGMGYWLVAADGGVFAYGDAAFQGSLGNKVLNAPIVGMAGNGTSGYWLVAADGGVFAYGSATFHGSAGAEVLNSPVVGMAATANGSGYYLVAADGGVFSYNAPFFGSASGVAAGMVTGITASAGGGYTLATDLGGVYAYGATYYGNQVGSGAADPVISMNS